MQEYIILIIKCNIKLQRCHVAFFGQDIAFRFLLKFSHVFSLIFILINFPFWLNNFFSCDVFIILVVAYPIQLNISPPVG